MSQQRHAAWVCAAVLAVAALAGCLADGEEVCNGHGRLETGPGSQCVCDSPAPAKGQWGWAGAQCDMRVFGAEADGSDVTAGCTGEGCQRLAPNDWMCFAVALPFQSPPQPWRYLAVQLVRTSAEEEGDPDLYGMFYGGASGAGHAPSHTTLGYDFRETSSSTHVSVVKVINRADFGADADYEGVYLCVKAYGDLELTYALRAFSAECPPGFTPQGDKMICSSRVDAPDAERRHSGCSEEGACECRPPYQQPVAEVYKGLGFKDCSAKVTAVGEDKFSGGHVAVLEHEKVDPGAWAFYAFNVSAEDYQVVVNVAAEAGEQCGGSAAYELFVKFGQPPGWRYNEWDFRPDWDYYSESDADLEVAFDQTSSAFQAGTWYAGLNSDEQGDCAFTITVSRYQCPMDCNGRGQCLRQANGTRYCDCDPGFFGADCANEAARLRYGQKAERAEAAFEYDYWQLPEVTPAMLTHSVEVVISATYASSEGYSSWVTSRPELLLLKGDEHSQPTAGNYTFRAVMQEQNTAYEIDLCPSQLKVGIWRVAIYNPLRAFKIGYTLTASKKAVCLNDCWGHGDCSEDGICHCHESWAGGDCSVNPTGACQQGTRRGQPMPDKHGTCWHECRCDDAMQNCKYEEGHCADFTCDGRARRRAPGADECVEDECTRDEWVDAGTHTCLRACACPDGGGPCKLAPACDGAHFACKDAWRRFSSGEPKCYEVGCKEGSLQAPGASSPDVPHGRAFAVCTCGGPGEESETQPLCSFTTASTDGRTIACDAGATLQGNTCQPVRRGTPGWGVFLWVLFSLLMGGALGLGGWFLWQWHRRRVAGVLSDGLYHELSMDTGF